MPAMPLFLILALLGGAERPGPRETTSPRRRPSAPRVQHFKERTGLTFDQCSDRECLRAHEKQGCRPAHLARVYRDTDGTQVLVDELVHPPLREDPKHPRDTGCAVTEFTYWTRDCRLSQSLCPELDFLPGTEEPGCYVLPYEKLSPCRGSPVSEAERQRNLARAEKEAQDQLRVFATPTLVGVQGGTWSGLEYSRALSCLAQEAVVTPPSACVAQGADLFSKLEAGDDCRVDADCSVLREPVPGGACCIAIGSGARQELAVKDWFLRLRTVCGAAESHCASCSAATCVKGRCRIAPGEVQIVWLNRCGYP